MINPGGYLVALAVGSLVGMVLLAVLKKKKDEPDAVAVSKSGQ